jgi:hypothetical protein
VETLLSLKPQDGYKIKALIDNISSGNFVDYCNSLNIKPPNFHAILTGGKKCSVEHLNKILSGIRYEAQISTVLIIQPMNDTLGVDNADYVLDEDTLLSDMLENDTTNDPHPVYYPPPPNYPSITNHPNYPPAPPIANNPIHIPKRDTDLPHLTQEVTTQELCSSELLLEAQKMYRGLPTLDTKEES